MHRHGLLLARASSRSAGFSFLEIMLVVLIIGIMTAIVAPNFVGKGEKAKVAATRQQIENLKTALQMFEMTAGRFPTTEEGLEALVRRPSNISEADWEQSMDEVPLDGWRRDFVYNCPGEEGRPYDLISKGADENDPDDDITSFRKSTDSTK